MTEEVTKKLQIITPKYHRLERFLHDVLHIIKENVDDQASEMEHSLSDDAEGPYLTSLNKPVSVQMMKKLSRYVIWNSKPAKNAKTEKH